MARDRITEDDTIIPDNLKNAAREIAEVCRKYKLRSCEAVLQPGFGGDFFDRLTLEWSDGRHGADAGVASLSYNRLIRVAVGEQKGA